MELIGSYQASGYSVETYFPENDRPEVWTICVVRDGTVVEEFHTRIATDAVYGIDHRTMVLVEAAAEAALAQVLQRASEDARSAFAAAA